MKIWLAAFIPIASASLVYQIIGNTLPVNESIMITGIVCGIVNVFYSIWGED